VGELLRLVGEVRTVTPVAPVEIGAKSRAASDRRPFESSVAPGETDSARGGAGLVDRDNDLSVDVGLAEASFILGLAVRARCSAPSGPILGVPLSFEATE
jgi:hypothetical protein